MSWYSFRNNVSDAVGDAASATGRFFGAGAHAVADATRLRYHRFKAHRAGKREAAFSDLEAHVRSELASMLGPAVAEMPIPDDVLETLQRWTKKPQSAKVAEQLEHALEKEYCVPVVFALVQTYADTGDLVSAAASLLPLSELPLSAPVKQEFKAYADTVFGVPYKDAGNHFYQQGEQNKPVTVGSRTYSPLECLHIAAERMPTNKDVHALLAERLAAGTRKQKREAPEHAQMALMLGHTDANLKTIAGETAPRMRKYVTINFDRVALDYKPFVDDMLCALYGRQREYTPAQSKEAYRALHRTSHLLDCGPAPDLVKAVKQLRKDGIGVELLTTYPADSVPYAQLWVFEQFGPFGARVVRTDSTTIDAYFRDATALAYVDTQTASLQKAAAAHVTPLYVGDKAAPAGIPKTSLKDLERTLLLR